MFDLSGLATLFGMSTMMLSGLVWLVISIIISAAVLQVPNVKPGIAMLVFDLCIIGGAVLGLIPVLVAVLMFIGFGVLTAYVLFFRGASI